MLSNSYENGTIRSVLFMRTDDKFETYDGVVRMSVPIAGFEITPDQNDPNKC